ncbi:aldehyde dehydrogenase [candidate division KSB1 bacterium]|nr:aldehyde dehydrogenase [candidate division KSB1 bacterium]TDI87390.1 MAG: aldehyde dehydrogenase [Caldithrix sp.]
MAQMFINGEWVDARSGATYEVKNPANGETIDTAPLGDAADANAAVESAKAAFKDWAAMAPDARAEILHKGINLAKEQVKDLAALLTKEQGKPFMESMGELNHCLHGMEFYVGLASKIRGSQVPLPPSMNPNCYGMIMKQPVGICVGIVPWNFPITLMGTKVGPALIAGNPIIVKPASTTPLTTLKIIGILNEAGLPAGILNCVTGPGSKVGSALIGHQDVRRVALTGSSETGRQVMETAGPDFKRITLELGGSDPMIVCPDADMKKAVNGAMIGRFWNAGQACLAVKRLYLFEEIYDEFLEQLVGKVGRYEPGDGMEKAEKPRIRMGPLHTAFQREEIEEQLQDAVDNGAKVLVGGKRPEGNEQGYFFEPAVVENVAEDSKLVTEEVFGPVLPVFKVSNLDEAIAKANNSKWGLGSSIWTNNMKYANQAAREIQSGMVWVNQIHFGYDEMPFGGVKASGIGHEHGPEALDYYFEPKSVVFGGLD